MTDYRKRLIAPASSALRIGDIISFSQGIRLSFLRIEELGFTLIEYPSFKEFWKMPWGQRAYRVGHFKRYDR